MRMLDVRNLIISEVQTAGFALAQAAYSFEEFTTTLLQAYPRASRPAIQPDVPKNGVHYMQGDALVGIWNEQVNVGAIGVKH